MPLKSLEHLASEVAYETLPANWNTFDLGRFSADKTLWDYQQQALRLALAVLFKYYEGFEDFLPGESPEADAARKRKMAEWYSDSMHLSERDRADLNLSLARTKSALRELIADYVPIDEENPRIDFERLCNRMGFWMATGSGKTLVLVKLLEILHLLMRREEIPTCDVLMLTHREDLIDQFQRTIAEYNHAPDAPIHIELRELREYPEAKREAPGGLLGRDSTLRVFYYRSDNLSDEHKERIVDFRNYDNGGRWYVLLDEAHKGVAEGLQAQAYLHDSEPRRIPLQLLRHVHRCSRLGDHRSQLQPVGVHHAWLRQAHRHPETGTHRLPAPGRDRLHRRRKAQGRSQEHDPVGVHGP